MPTRTPRPAGAFGAQGSGRGADGCPMKAGRRCPEGAVARAGPCPGVPDDRAPESHGRPQQHATKPEGAAECGVGGQTATE